MNEIMTFVNEEFGSVRSAIINGEPWLVGKDIATILGYENQNRDIIRHVDEEDRLILNQETQYRFGIEFDYRTLGQRGGWMVNESGFYSLVLASKLPSAKKFKRWVTSVVLPTIRRTGGYVANEDMFVETYLPFADDAVKGLFKIQCQVINQLNDRIRRDEPKVRFADHVSDTSDLVDMSEMAKLCADHGIRIGRTRLFAWLRANGFLMAGNLPYQRYIERGYFRVKESVFDYCGEPKIYQQTYVTGKGQQYLLARIIRDFQEAQ